MITTEDFYGNIPLAPNPKYIELSEIQLKQEINSLQEELNNRALIEERGKKLGEDKIILYGAELTLGALLLELQYERYYLCNYTPRKLHIHRRINGGCYGYIYGALADKLGAQYDGWNFNVYAKRGYKP